MFLKMFKMIIYLFIVVLSVACTVDVRYTAAKKSPVEKYVDDTDSGGEDIYRYRRKWGVLATGVCDMKVGTSQLVENMTRVFISQKSGEYSFIDFTKKLSRSSSIRYTSKKFPIKVIDLALFGELAVFRASNGEVKQMGEDQLIAPQDRKKIVKYWANKDMLAYIADNTLKIAWVDIEGSPAQFFQGKADKIKKVVAGNAWWNRYNVFVLMRDGSVWGMGNNRKHMISDSSKKSYKGFVKICGGGIKNIGASKNNVVVLKNDHTLWVWGKDKARKRSSARLRRIDSNVKNFSLSEESVKDETALLYVKQDGTAYGWGCNRWWSLSDSFKAKWHEYPVKLMEGIDRVASGDELSLLLGEDKTLYWRGRFSGWPYLSFEYQ